MQTNWSSKKNISALHYSLHKILWSNMISKLHSNFIVWVILEAKFWAILVQNLNFDSRTSMSWSFSNFQKLFGILTKIAVSTYMINVKLKTGQIFSKYSPDPRFRSIYESKAWKLSSALPKNLIKIIFSQRFWQNLKH